MSSEVSAMMVMFIAALTAAGLVSAVVIGVVGDMSNQLRDQGDNMADAIGTGLAVVNDPKNVPYSDPDLTIYIKNTGSRTLANASLTVLLDGRHENITANSLLGDADRWSPGVVNEITVEEPGLGGDHAVKVIHTPSVSDEMEFRI